MSSPAAEAPSGSDLYAIVLNQLDAAARVMHLDPDMHRVLRTPKRVLTVQIPIEDAGGEVRVFTGHRVQHNINRGPAIGGLRYHPGVTLDEVMALAMQMSWKCALMRLPFGGAAGAVVCDPARFTGRQREHLTRRYATEVGVLIGPTSDIHTPDINTDSQVMAWIMDTYSMHRGYSAPAVVTGKPVSIGGSEGHYEATGRGVYYLLEELAAVRQFTLPGCRIAIQGFGTVGGAAANVLHQAGARIVAVSDSAGGVYRADGLDIPLLLAHKRQSGAVYGFAGAESITNADLLTCDCDVLIPAAVSNQITARNAGQVQARVVIEAASGPVTEEADTILDQRGVVVLPDILASAGGVTVSYFEWVQGLQESFWTEQEVHDRLQAALREAFQTLEETRLRLGVSYRAAAYVQAVGVVAAATDVRGIYP